MLRRMHLSLRQQTAARQQHEGGTDIGGERELAVRQFGEAKVVAHLESVIKRG